MSQFAAVNEAHDKVIPDTQVQSVGIYQPSRLNPLYPVNIVPFMTTPFIGAEAPSREDIDISSMLRPRFNRDKRNYFNEQAYNRWSFITDKIQDPQHVVFPIPRSGINTRVQYQNYADLMDC